MNQKNPLLNYRIKCDTRETSVEYGIRYDFKTGLWIDKFEEPVIKKYVDSNVIDCSGETLLTKTREGIDRSEGSNLGEQFGFKKSDLYNQQTSITETRESVDMSEKMYEESEFNDHIQFMAGETLLTRTREGVDRSEGSNMYESLSMETSITFTRESVDRSENS